MLNLTTVFILSIAIILIDFGIVIDTVILFRSLLLLKILFSYPVFISFRKVFKEGKSKKNYIFRIYFKSSLIYLCAGITKFHDTIRRFELCQT